MLNSDREGESVWGGENKQASAQAHTCERVNKYKICPVIQVLRHTYRHIAFPQTCTAIKIWRSAFFTLRILFHIYYKHIYEKVKIIWQKHETEK